MAKQKEAWDKLSMQEKAQLIKLSVDNGVSSLKQIRDTYNLYNSGGNLVHKKSGEEQKESQDLNYPNGVIRQGKQDILKKIVQSPVGAFTRFIDPTGILSIPDAYYDLKHLVETPTTQRTTADYVDAVASIVGLFPLGNNISDFVKVKNWRQGLQLANKYAEHLPFKLVGVYPDMYQYHNQKSTGGPLYPFSFEKNPFLKTPAVRYDDGGFFARLFGKKDTPPTPEEIKADRVERFINDTWETEYSVPKGYDPVTGLYFPYDSPEGGTKTIGPGFKLREDGSGDATMFSAKEAARGVTREQINEKLRAQGELQYDKVLEFLNQKGNRLPIDTINPNIMNGLMDLRFQVGTLGGWNNLREAVLNGDLEGIKKESKVTFKDEKTGKIKVDTRRNDLRAEKFWHYD